MRDFCTVAARLTHMYMLQIKCHAIGSQPIAKQTQCVHDAKSTRRVRFARIRYGTGPSVNTALVYRPLAILHHIYYTIRLWIVYSCVGPRSICTLFVLFYVSCTYVDVIAYSIVLYLPKKRVKNVFF